MWEGGGLAVRRERGPGTGLVSMHFFWRGAVALGLTGVSWRLPLYPILQTYLRLGA